MCDDAAAAAALLNNASAGRRADVRQTFRCCSDFVNAIKQHNVAFVSQACFFCTLGATVFLSMTVGNVSRDRKVGLDLGARGAAGTNEPSVCGRTGWTTLIRGRRAFTPPAAEVCDGTTSTSLHLSQQADATGTTRGEPLFEYANAIKQPKCLCVIFQRRGRLSAEAGVKQLGGRSQSARVIDKAVWILMRLTGLGHAGHQSS